jgi:uncharacterized membrane protein
VTAIPLTDTRLQRLIGATLRSGVMVASITGIFGGLLYLAAPGAKPVSFHFFEGTQSLYSFPGLVLLRAFQLHGGSQYERGLAITQLGVMALLLTPIIRVVFSIVGFALEHDRIYVAITCIVLATLVGSLLLH